MTVELQPNGTYRFTEWTRQEGDEYTGAHWAVTHWSGIYETAADAELDARRMLPWLRDKISD
ncbi:MAG: hypothetical protein ACHQAY_06025 [Hyphomicrobiales bacterium]